MGSIDASELEEVADDIDRQLATLPARTYDAGRDVGRTTERVADVVTTRRTGYLASRNQVRVTPLSLGFEVVMTNDADYAAYVEDGTSDTEAQPFAGPTADIASGDIGPALLDISLDL